MVIDLATWRAAGEPPEFEWREQVAVRGRSQREDPYVPPLGAGLGPGQAVQPDGRTSANLSGRPRNPRWVTVVDSVAPTR